MHLPTLEYSESEKYLRTTRDKKSKPRSRFYLPWAKKIGNEVDNPHSQLQYVSRNLDTFKFNRNQLGTVLAYVV